MSLPDIHRSTNDVRWPNGVVLVRRFLDMSIILRFSNMENFVKYFELEDRGMDALNDIMKTEEGEEQKSNKKKIEY